LGGKNSIAGSFLSSLSVFQKSNSARVSQQNARSFVWNILGWHNAAVGRVELKINCALFQEGIRTNTTTKYAAMAPM
jgi:hypothetical protein